MIAKTTSVIILLFCFTLCAQAQSVGRLEGTETNIDAYHYYVQPGAATVQVQVLGTVNAPGLYEVGAGTDLGTLVALTGGPALDAREPSRRRTIMLRLYRTQGGSPQDPIFESTLEDATGGATPYPTLQDGDVLAVEVIERRRLNWRDIFPIITTIASVTFAIDRLTD